MAETNERIKKPSRTWPISDEQAVAALARRYCSFQSYIQDRERVLMVGAVEFILDIVEDCETMGPSDFRAKYGRNKPSWGRIHVWLREEKNRRERHDEAREAASRGK